ncbi:MAG: hypothetical protein KIT72_17925 [Polyangiaceae bacterium]|nr:hypothetical protein [Polyangiaceae bacterium]MCW5792294.1 hypothetical protein [Polyangiaceae bacterium]
MNSRRSVFSLAAICLAALLACKEGTDNPAVSRLSVKVHGAGGELTRECVYLPVLLGSNLERTIPSSAGLRIRIEATRDEAHITTSGAFPNVKRTVTQATLEAGYAEEFSLDVQGARYQLNLASQCDDD